MTAPELIEPVVEPVLPEFIEPVDEPVPLERVEPAAEPDVEPGCSGAVMVDDPPVPPIGAVWPPVDGEPVVVPAPPALPVPVDWATAMLVPKASATPAAMLINLGYLLMIWLSCLDVEMTVCGRDAPLRRSAGASTP
jgi:hypothetical protein